MVTPLQHKIYTFIAEYLAAHEYSPSLVEIATGIGISPNSISLISRHIHALVKEGRLAFQGKGYRNLQLVESNTGCKLPVLGRIAAGQPILAVEDKQEVDLTKLLNHPNHFILQVQGDSMQDEGILSGDMVICRHAQHAAEGEIVVALIDGLEATLKRISYQLQHFITLIPANPAFKPKAYAPERIEIQGVFIGLLRLNR